MDSARIKIKENVRHRVKVIKLNDKEGKLVDAKHSAGCGQLKVLTEYHTDAKGVGGRKAYCKYCRVQTKKMD
ncbi:MULTISPECIES: hypothetical protein [unclassified Paenibacillus]|uniref:hypothetical protein n=1 Tax=unclassified Paenibacillus TaxID=185978 RepID=UPI002783285B|nr:MULTISPECIES: hypothetical protein [unclassified Paenibacillus]MDQ0896360.1 hypothetical protein [Paenibacillus sp. V4I7]MDQ0914097.1 hypothetical protein [Paenibacillus sp. V4I5]